MVSLETRALITTADHHIKTLCLHKKISHKYIVHTTN